MCGFLGARLLFSECPLFPGELGSHRAASLFHQARVKLFENVDYSHGLRGICEGPARRLILEKRDKYKRTEMKAKAKAEATATAKEKEKASAKARGRGRGRGRGKRWRRRRRRRRRRRSNTRHSERANLAILVRRYDLTHPPPPTIYNSQLDHSLNVHYSLRESDEPLQSKQVARGPGSYLIRGSWLVLGWFCPLPLHPFDSSQPPRIDHPSLFHRKT